MKKESLEEGTGVKSLLVVELKSNRNVVTSRKIGEQMQEIL